MHGRYVAWRRWDFVVRDNDKDKEKMNVYDDNDDDDNE